MSGSAFFFMLVGISYLTAQVFRFVEFIER